MAWEKRRNGRLYYYQSESVGGRVVKRYIGTGELADLIASSADIRHQLDRARLARRRETEEALHYGEPLISAFCDQVDALFREAMTAAGYHQHDRGAWRKKRKGTADA